MKPGTNVAGRYTIESELGRGGMGAVYVARDEKFEQRVALKVAGAAGVAADDFKKRFAREARLGNVLGKTPGLVRALDWGELDDGSLYLAMDLVQGAEPLDLKTGTLAERLARLRAATRLVAEIHRQHVIHRDLKPANFLQGRDGTLWLTDFGLAKMLGDEETAGPSGSPGLTLTGTAMGMPAFMPPEQYDDTSKVDARADVYALGVMLFVALTEGRMPFEGSAASIVQKHTRVRDGGAPAPRAKDLRSDVPDELDALCSSAIAMRPEERLASADALLAGLDAFLGAALAPEGPPRAIGKGDPGEGPKHATVAQASVASALTGSNAPPTIGAGSTRPEVPTRPGIAMRPEVAKRAPLPDTVSSPPSPRSSAPRGKGTGVGVLVLAVTVLSLGALVFMELRKEKPGLAATTNASTTSPASTTNASHPATTTTTPPASTTNASHPASATNATPPSTKHDPPPKPHVPKLPALMHHGKKEKLPAGGEVEVFTYDLPEKAGAIEMVYVPAGDFVMGADGAGPEEAPRHVRRMAKGYWIGRHAITWGEYLAFCKIEKHREPARPSFWKTLEEPHRHPVVDVSWNDAVAFCKWAGLRLPTEAEWEKAARGTDGRKFPWGEEWDPKKANFCDVSCPDKNPARDASENDDWAYTAPVGTFLSGASPYGALEMAGNVLQWCADSYDAKAYERWVAEKDDTQVVGDERVCRGGSWNRAARECRTTARLRHAPAQWFSGLGFRPVKPEE